MGNVVGIIPARIGSKSIKKKNIRDFNGKPLIAWSIECALKSKLDRVIVSTDSQEIKDISLSYGAEVPFLRSKNLSDDKSNIESVLKNVYEYITNIECNKVDAMAMLLPTSPFRCSQDIDNAIEIYNKNNVTSVVSVSLAEANMNPHWMLIENKNEVQLFNGDRLTSIKDRRQDLPKVYIRNDFIYLLDPNNLFESKANLYGCKVKMLKIPEHRYDIDLNTEKDWIVAESIFKLL